MSLYLPRRISPPHPIGTLFKAARKERKAQRTQREPDYLALVRQLPCLCCGMEPCGEAHHVRAGAFRMGRRPSDASCVPVCRSCHQIDRDSLHRVGEEAFWARVGLDPRAVAQRLHDAGDDLVRMRMVVMVAISERKGSK